MQLRLGFLIYYKTVPLNLVQNENVSFAAGRNNGIKSLYFSSHKFCRQQQVENLINFVKIRKNRWNFRHKTFSPPNKADLATNFPSEGIYRLRKSAAVIILFASILLRLLLTLLAQVSIFFYKCFRFGLILNSSENWDTSENVAFFLRRQNRRQKKYLLLQWLVFSSPCIRMQIQYFVYSQQKCAWDEANHFHQLVQTIQENVQCLKTSKCFLTAFFKNVRSKLLG